MRISRGARNCNPLNIRRGSSWVGLSVVQSDEEFCQFMNIKYGVRAACVILFRYSQRGVRSVHDIIYTWAPPSENKTALYLDFVCRATLFSPDKIIDCFAKDDVLQLLHAMAYFECGQSFSREDFEDGFNMFRRAFM